MPKTKQKPKPNALVSRRGRNNRHALANALSKREPPTVAEAVEKVLIQGDLSPLTPEQRVDYYKKVCLSLSLNPLTNPFLYILFREAGGGEKLQLYATKSCAEQLRKLHGVSVDTSQKAIEDDICSYEVSVHDRTGRTDSALGAVPLYKFKDGKRINLAGVEWCNAVMKAHTKAKRRATLSICGLAFLDESELDGIQAIGGVTPEGRIYRYPQLAEQNEERNEAIETLKARGLWCEEHNCAMNGKHMREAHKEPEQAANPKAQEIPPEKNQPPKSPVQAKKIASIKTMPDHDVAVSGYLADEPMTKFLADVSAIRFKSQKDGGIYWRFAPNYLDGFKKLCEQLDVEVA